ncbi:MAG: ABC transporter permease [Chitinophagales bacterium]|nr:ABC transporter permease [Chitinophagales bacterium]
MAEQKKYNQIRAMLAIFKASLRSIFRSPSAVVFSFAFPLIFIIVFGFVGNKGFSLEVGIASSSDTSNLLFHNLNNMSAIRLIRKETAQELISDLKKGRIDGIVTINRNANNNESPLIVNVRTSQSSRNAQLLLNTLQSLIDKATLQATPDKHTVAEIKEEKLPGREYRSIDFILPGMLGFSLLSTGVFGTAFVFLNLRQSLVIKRFFATPIERPYIVLGEALSRILFALITSSVILILGHFAFGFTLIYGWITFIDMLLLSFIGLFVFMGFGFVVSGLAKNEAAVPPIANIITMPQFLLAGTFFSTDNFPAWLQPVTRILPLTYLNDAMRKVAFEGASIAQIGSDLLVLSIWGIVIYFVAIKVFRWE